MNESAAGTISKYIIPLAKKNILFINSLDKVICELTYHSALEGDAAPLSFTASCRWNIEVFDHSSGLWALADTIVPALIPLLDIAVSLISRISNLGCVTPDKMIHGGLIQ